MITASKKLDYGLLLMANLPDADSDTFRSLQEIANEKNLSSGYLSQLMIPLKKAGLVHSREGVGGGYQLAKPKESISLNDVYSALEGPLSLTACLNKEKSCVCSQDCSTKFVWSDLQKLMLDYLNNKTLADVR